MSSESVLVVEDYMYAAINTARAIKIYLNLATEITGDINETVLFLKRIKASRILFAIVDAGIGGHATHIDDGWELAKYIKSEYNIPTCIITAQPSPEHIQASTSLKIPVYYRSVNIRDLIKEISENV